MKEQEILKLIQKIQAREEVFSEIIEELNQRVYELEKKQTKEIGHEHDFIPCSMMRHGSGMICRNCNKTKMVIYRNQEWNCDENEKRTKEN